MSFGRLIEADTQNAEGSYLKHASTSCCAWPPWHMATGQASKQLIRYSDVEKDFKSNYFKPWSSDISLQNKAVPTAAAQHITIPGQCSNPREKRWTPYFKVWEDERGRAVWSVTWRCDLTEHWRVWQLQRPRSGHQGLRESVNILI